MECLGRIRRGLDICIRGYVFRGRRKMDAEKERKVYWVRERGAEDWTVEKGKENEWI